MTPAARRRPETPDTAPDSDGGAAPAAGHRREPAAPHIGHLLLLADVDGDVLLLGTDTHHHALVDLYAGADEQGATVLRIEQTVADGLAAGLEGHQRAGVAPVQVALIGA